MYLGREALTRAEVLVSGEHIVGVSTQGGGYFHSVDELGDLASGDEFWLTILTDGAPGRLTVTLELLANEKHLRRLTVEAPEPVSVPVVTEHSVD